MRQKNKKVNFYSGKNKQLLFKSKKSQAEIIVTVLLILIAITAVAFVSSFIFKLVKDNLSSTDCFKTVGKLQIDLTAGMTYFKYTTNQTYVSIQRGQGEFNLTGISVSVGNSQTSKAFEIKEASSVNGVEMYDGGSIFLPGPGEKRTYIINANMTGVNKVVIAPIVSKDKKCDATDEQSISEQA